MVNLFVVKNFYIIFFLPKVLYNNYRYLFCVRLYRRNIMSSNVGGVSSAGNAGGNSGIEKRPSFVTVKKGENLTIIAKRYGMSKAEFVKWTGLKGVIRVGQKIELPVDSVEAGKGIYALARKYGMPMAEFAKMILSPKIKSCAAARRAASMISSSLAPGLP